MTSSLSHIIDGLTEAQRKAMLGKPFDGHAGALTLGTARALYRKGLTVRASYLSPLTPLGLEVRSALQASSKASDGEDRS